jgi:hypothetical protein
MVQRQWRACTAQLRYSCSAVTVVVLPPPVCYQHGHDDHQHADGNNDEQRVDGDYSVQG